MNILRAHHDGSELYVSNAAPKIGEYVELKVRIPKSDKPEKIFVRLFHDGEPRTFELKKGKSTKVETWWSVSIEIMNAITHYRFMLVDKGGYRWLNGVGVFNHDVTDREDFQIVAKRAYPRWLKSAVFYQVFPDRFANSGIEKKVPHWAIPRNWNDKPIGKGSETPFEFFGGDLAGAESKLPHIKKLGATAIYFTPIFPSESNHRYDAASFDQVDPLLGGDKAFIKFLTAARSYGMKTMIDLTTNHCGDAHPWFKKAKKSSRAKEREFFYFNEDGSYESWWGVSTLPKLNYASKKLRELMFSGKKSVVKKWLTKPFEVDGWRIDVGNMTGIRGEIDINREVAEEIRAAVDEVNPDAWLVAENADHSPRELDGGTWHGTMNYNGFARPLVNFFYDPSVKIPNFSQFPVANPSFDGYGTFAILQAFAAGIPWRSLTASMVLLDSHDTARFRTVVKNDRTKHLAAITAQMTYPGVPSVLYGDEVGLEGAWGEDARRTIDWENPTKWDHELFDGYQELIDIRKKSDALCNGGLRWIYVDENAFAYLRESSRESLLVFISRKGGRHTIKLAPFGYSIDQVLYGPQAKGDTVRISSKSACSAIYRLK